MNIIKLVHNNNVDFVKELQDMRLMLKEKNIIIGLVESDEGNSQLIKIMCDKEQCDSKTINMIYLYISNILYNIVIEEYRKKELFVFLTDTFFFLKHEEILDVETLVMNILKGEESLKDSRKVFCINKINSIIEKIKSCLEENTEINIKGFIRFRMKEICEDIEEIVDKIVEEYMVEKEYKEFVKLLKYFVEIQESRIDIINIYVISNEKYLLIDGDGNDIFEEFVKELSNNNEIDTEAKIEDIIISGLITNAPKKLIIHKRQNCGNKEFIDTINYVFGERVTFCDTCLKCNNVNIEL